MDFTAPQPDAEDGNELLGAVEKALARYVVLPTHHATVAVVLWIAATHALPAFEHATRLAIHSAVKRCGKSRLLEVIEALVHDPVSTTNISVPALFRMIEAAGDRPPTLILDEADRMFGSVKKDEDNRELIAVLNNGFREGSPTWRCVGPMQTPTAFSNYAMVVVAGIGRKPDTVEDRAVNVTMRRRLPGEQVSKFRLRTDRPALHEMRDRLAVWVAASLAEIEKPVQNVPDGLEDRAEDAWEPLLAIADAAAGRWPARARAAAKALTAEAADDDDQSEDLRLLGDVDAVFKRMTGVSFLATKILLAELAKVDDAPWAEDRFTPHKLARALLTFRVRPRHNDAKTERGYHRSDFEDAFARYLRPDRPEVSGTGSEQ
jgi:Protein of unknown function (DUF3631)